MARGFLQVPHIDFQHVFSLVSKYAITRMMFAFSVMFWWKRYLLDMKSAFVDATFKQEIFVSHPNGLKKAGKHDHVYLLEKTFTDCGRLSIDEMFPSISP